MVIAYRMSPVSWFFIRRLIRTEFAGLPNIILDRAVVPELIQENLTPGTLADELQSLLGNGASQQKVAFKEILSALDTRFGDHCASVLMNRLGR